MQQSIAAEKCKTTYNNEIYSSSSSSFNFEYSSSIRQTSQLEMQKVKVTV